MTDRLAAGPAVVLAIVLFLLWEALVRLLQVPAFLVPAPSSVLGEIAGSPVYFARQSWMTLEVTLYGFLLSAASAFVLAILIVEYRVLERTLYAGLIAMNSVPKVAVAPLFVVWLGSGSASKVAMVVLISIFVMVIEFVHGLKSVEREILDLGRVFRANRLRMLWKIRIPNALPSMFVGMKIGITLALIGAIVGEFVATRQGLGYVIMVAQGTIDTTRMFAAILVLALLGTLLFYGMALLERLCVPWHVSQRGRGD